MASTGGSVGETLEVEGAYPSQRSGYSVSAPLSAQPKPPSGPPPAHMVSGAEDFVSGFWWFQHTWASQGQDSEVRCTLCAIEQSVCMLDFVNGRCYYCQPKLFSAYPASAETQVAVDQSQSSEGQNYSMSQSRESSQTRLHENTMSVQSISGLDQG